MNNTTSLSNITSATSTTTISDVDQFFSDFVDFCITFIIPIICSYGIIANVLNIIVFSHSEFKDLAYRYLYVNAYLNIIYLAHCFFLFVGRCGIYCTFSSTLAANIYMNYFYNYLKGIPVMSTVFLQILVALYRYLVITNRISNQLKYFKRTICIIVVLSTVFYLPILLTKKIKETITPKSAGNVTTYIYTYSIGRLFYYYFLVLSFNLII